MWFFLIALILLVIAGFVSLALNKFPRVATNTGVMGTVIACVLGIIPAAKVIFTGQILSLHLKWHIPYGSFFVEIDPLSAFFIIPILVLSALCAIYGSKYLSSWFYKKPIGVSWFFFNILTASMVMVTIARNGILFLLAWEIMSISSFFLVVFENEKKEARNAGLIYLLATHFGTAFLIALFILLGQRCGSLDFDQILVYGFGGSSIASVLFLLALIGFGTKAGFMPFHVWLPEAHPAAPSHVSALMSGVMIKTGIYGLLRIFTFLGQPQFWWGWILIIIGFTSGILGVLFALAQHDLKRLLAYHSIENIGIIVLGLGIGFLGMSYGSPVLIVLGFAGGLLHVINHALFKGLLFLGAGSVIHSTGTRDIDSLGGCLKKMPYTGITFLIGAIAISGLPPLNGFISEFMIYLAAFYGILSDITTIIPSLLVIGGLALIGGLATACFTKAFGIIFLGEPRSEHAKHAHEVNIAMKIPMVILAAACILIGFTAPFLLAIFKNVLPQITGLNSETLTINLAKAINPLSIIVFTSIILIVISSILLLFRKIILLKRTINENLTWDCGYAQPTPRMQYTASSFAQPLIKLFGFLLHTRIHYSKSKSLFPEETSFSSETPDIFTENVYSPIFIKFSRFLRRLRWFQHGELHLYILYIVITLLILLIWKLM